MINSSQSQYQSDLLYLKLLKSISQERLGEYLKASGFNTRKALRLYTWNAEISGALFFPIQAVEVFLRNSINNALIIIYGDDWWRRTNSFSNISSQKVKSSLGQARRRIENSHASETTAELVATLSFDFWVHLLDSRYNIDIWSQQLAIQFPELPNDTGREELKNAVAKVATLRNRICHHKPIHKSNISEEYAHILKTLKWQCSTTHKWVRRHAKVSEVMRKKP